MAFGDLVRKEVRDFAQQVDDGIRSCLNRLSSVLTSIDGLTPEDLIKIGFDTEEIRELSAIKDKWVAIKNEIEAQGY